MSAGARHAVHPTENFKRYSNPQETNRSEKEKGRFNTSPGERTQVILTIFKSQRQYPAIFDAESLRYIRTDLFPSTNESKLGARTHMRLSYWRALLQISWLYS